jgi:hypothetical protein
VAFLWFIYKNKNYKWLKKTKTKFLLVKEREVNTKKLLSKHDKTSGEKAYIEQVDKTA